MSVDQLSRCMFFGWHKVRLRRKTLSHEFKQLDLLACKCQIRSTSANALGMFGGDVMHCFVSGKKRDP